MDAGNVDILAAFERGLGGPFDGNAAKVAWCHVLLCFTKFLKSKGANAVTVDNTFPRYREDNFESVYLRHSTDTSRDTTSQQLRLSTIRQQACKQTCACNMHRGL